MTKKRTTPKQPKRFRMNTLVLTPDGRTGHSAAPFTAADESVEIEWSNPDHDGSEPGEPNKFWPYPESWHYRKTTEATADVILWRNAMWAKNKADSDAWWNKIEADGGRRITIGFGG